jgi:hypothetical protein
MRNEAIEAPFPRRHRTMRETRRFRALMSIIFNVTVIFELLFRNGREAG